MTGVTCHQRQDQAGGLIYLRSTSARIQHLPRTAAAAADDDDDDDDDDDVKNTQRHHDALTAQYLHSLEKRTTGHLC